ncbi:bone morphogenetic protein receptor type-1B-like isoform X1 [Leptinotarsa decemlineata]|uniref:bone morphogenetic protein receptor type-1B-like isoform X1 n=1 Tax=Leptinotarsa decemlineata TaxID=7539 RepID=UPI003D305750
MDYDYSDEDSDNEEEAPVVQCYCKGHCPFEDPEREGLCEVTIPGGKCFASVVVETDDYEDDYPTLTFGCLPDTQMATLQCKGSLVPHFQSKSIECCNDADFCNSRLFPKHTIKNVSLHHKMPYILLGSSVTLCFTVLVAIIAFVFWRYRRKKRKEKVENNSNTEKMSTDMKENIDESNKYIDRFQSSTLPQLIEESAGSGSGPTIMVQRTISKQLEMQRVVGKGRYGEVWFAKRQGEKVAAKVFLTTEEKSWKRELEVYQTIHMRHENILGFIASDIRGSCGWTQMILITDFHEYGSVYDYLQTRTIDPRSLVTMAWSISRGLTHLHEEIFDVHGKPAIAHRDIKSKNILVKADGECCIADFGLAVQFKSNTNKINLPSDAISGTKRYMAPEILNDTIDNQNIYAHKMADIYALGLVLWEMSRRCNFDEQFDLEYQIPFQDNVSNNPTFEEMKEVVCVKKIRPEIPDSWDNHEIMKTFAKIMQEMWHENPAVRLTAMRVKKTLNKLRTANGHIAIYVYTANNSSKYV